MTASFPAAINDVVIASGTSATRAIRGIYEYSDATNIGIQSPPVLDALTFTIEVSQNGSTWSTLSNGTDDIIVPAAGEAIQYTEMLPFAYWRIKASNNVAADHIFSVSKQWTV